MANRTIQQKIIKRNKQRRAWAKPYSMKGTGLTASPYFIGEDNQPKPISISSRSRAAGIPPSTGSFESIKAGNTPIQREPWLQAIFKDQNPLYTVRNGEYVRNDDGIYLRSTGPGANPRAAVLAKLIQSTEGKGTLQGEQQFNYVKLLNGEFLQLRLYFAGMEAFFVEKAKSPKNGREVFRKSIIYRGKERAMNAYTCHRIAWAYASSS